MKKLFPLLIFSTLSVNAKSQGVAAKTSIFELGRVKQIIAEKNKEYVAAYLRGDSAAFSNLHHSETINMPPGEPMIFGKGAIGATVKNVPEQGVKDMIITTTNISGGPSEVIEEGKFGIVMPEKVHNGKYIVIWKQELGEWKIFRAIWNMDAAW